MHKFCDNAPITHCETDINMISPTVLVNLEDIRIDTALPVDERLAAYVKFIKNPYCFRVGETVVQIKFSDTEATLAQRLESYLKQQ